MIAQSLYSLSYVVRTHTYTIVVGYIRETRVYTTSSSSSSGHAHTTIRYSVQLTSELERTERAAATATEAFNNMPCCFEYIYCVNNNETKSASRISRLVLCVMLLVFFPSPSSSSLNRRYNSEERMLYISNAQFNLSREKKKKLAHTLCAVRFAQVCAHLSFIFSAICMPENERRKKNTSKRNRVTHFQRRSSRRRNEFI